MCGPDVDNTAQQQQQRDAKRARREEEARTRRIDAGLGDIASLFEGGRYRSGTETVDGYKPPAIESVTVPGKTSRDPESGGSLTSASTVRFQVGDRSFGSREEAKAYRERLAGRESTKPVFSRTQGVEPFLKDRRTALEGFYLPQLDQQQQDASDDLINALARAGLSRSSVANDKAGELEQRFALASADIASDIDRDIANTRSAFERERTAIEAGLRSTGDRSAALEGAQRAIFNVSSDAPDFSALPALFEGVATGIGGVAAAQRNEDLRRRISDGVIGLRDPGGKVIGV